MMQKWPSKGGAFSLLVKIVSSLTILALLFVGAALLGGTTAAHASTSDPAVWVGSPFSGNWPNSDGCAGAVYPSDNCSLPSVHHIVYYNPVGNFLDDWAADFQGVSAGTSVYLYAAPQTNGLSITAKVETVGPACADLNIAHGGYRVTVAFYNGSTRIGTATYAHITPSVSQGATINRWGTMLGTIGSYTNNSCWQGVHVHFEMSSQHNYACYNKGWKPGQHMDPTNFIGFIGGDYASAPRMACP
jgi:hypothetical protein